MIEFAVGAGTFATSKTMERLGRNLNRYCGETIDIQATLKAIESASREHGWSSEAFFKSDQFELIALRRPAQAPLPPEAQIRVYISTGIHGDEPAGPRAVLRLLRENKWPANVDLWLCPCLNPMGFILNSRENSRGVDLNRGYLKPVSDEIVSHIAWLERQPRFDMCLLLHEDWESQGFYLYEQNPDRIPAPAESIVDRVSAVCPIDRSELIEGRPAQGGIIRPNIDINSRPDWPEAFYVIRHKTRLSYTLEAPSDFPLSVRESALVIGVEAALQFVSKRGKSTARAMDSAGRNDA